MQRKIKELLGQKENGAKIYILDVRRHNDYVKFHIDGTDNLPFDEISRMPQILPDRNADIYLFCNSGSYSRSAKTVLNYLGYRNVYDLGAAD